MDFMTSDQLFDELIKGGLIPTKKYAMNTASFNEVMQKVLAFTANMNKVTAHWWNIWDNTAAQTYQSSLDELFAGVISPKDFVDKVQASFKK
jgi:ABC-type glycerol-3-phosphate transport system substrate-binding protein